MDRYLENCSTSRVAFHNGVKYLRGWSLVARQSPTTGGKRMKTRIFVMGGLAALALLVGVAVFAAAAGNGSGDLVRDTPLGDLVPGAMGSGKGMSFRSMDGDCDGEGPILENERSRNETCDGEPSGEQVQERERSRDGESASDDAEQTREREMSRNGTCDGEPTGEQVQERERSRDGESSSDDAEQTREREMSRNGTCDGEGPHSDDDIGHHGGEGSGSMKHDRIRDREDCALDE